MLAMAACRQGWAPGEPPQVDAAWPIGRDHQPSSAPSGTRESAALPAAEWLRLAGQGLTSASAALHAAVVAAEDSIVSLAGRLGADKTRSARPRRPIAASSSPRCREAGCRQGPTGEANESQLPIRRARLLVFLADQVAVGGGRCRRRAGHRIAIAAKSTRQACGRTPSGDTSHRSWRSQELRVPTARIVMAAAHDKRRARESACAVRATSGPVPVFGLEDAQSIHSMSTTWVRNANGAQLAGGWGSLADCSGGVAAG